MGKNWITEFSVIYFGIFGNFEILTTISNKIMGVLTVLGHTEMQLIMDLPKFLWGFRNKCFIILTIEEAVFLPNNLQSFYLCFVGRGILFLILQRESLADNWFRIWESEHRVWLSGNLLWGLLLSAAGQVSLLVLLIQSQSDATSQTHTPCCWLKQLIQKTFCAVAGVDDRFMQFNFSASKIVSDHE